MFVVHNRLVEFKNTTVWTSYFGFVLRLKLKAEVFKYLRFEQRFEKLCFRDGLEWTVGLIEIKLRFLRRSVGPALCCINRVAPLRRTPEESISRFVVVLD